MSGNNIFDALSGAPGTYISIDMYGNVGFGFDPVLWEATLKWEDTQNAQKQAAGTGALDYKWDGFQVVVTKDGLDTQVYGPIPELYNLQQQLYNEGLAYNKLLSDIQRIEDFGSGPTAQLYASLDNLAQQYEATQNRLADLTNWLADILGLAH